MRGVSIDLENAEENPEEKSFNATVGAALY